MGAVTMDEDSSSAALRRVFFLKVACQANTSTAGLEPAPGGGHRSDVCVTSTGRVNLGCERTRCNWAAQSTGRRSREHEPAIAAGRAGQARAISQARRVMI
jgi:hypothetical protein